MAYSFCPQCGSQLKVLQDQPLAPQTCAQCGATQYHNSRPCAGALIVRDHSVLLVQRAIEPFKDYWDIPGGFLEPGEHPEDGTRREVLEETGLDVEITGLHGIYMDRYAYDDYGGATLNIYYLATPKGNQPHAADDAAALQWFVWDHLPEQIAFEPAKRVLADWQAKELELVSV